MIYSTDDYFYLTDGIEDSRFLHKIIEKLLLPGHVPSKHDLRMGGGCSSFKRQRNHRH